MSAWCKGVYESMSMASEDIIATSEETAVRGSRIRVDAKWPMWNLQRLRRRSPFDDLGSIQYCQSGDFMVEKRRFLVPSGSY